MSVGERETGHAAEAPAAERAERAPAGAGPSLGAPSTPPALRALAGVRGAQASRVALMRRLQASSGNAGLLALLREAGQDGAPPGGGAAGPEGGGQAAEPGAAGAGAVHSEQETFVPEEFSEVPDEYMHLAVVDGGDQGEAGHDHGAHQGEATAPATRFVDRGRVGTGRYGAPVRPGGHAPRAFTDGGRTATTAWGGGGGAGARGVEGAGSIQAQVAPVYESRANAATSDADAWVRAGTGTVQVTRSWIGINAGDQGNGHFVTAGAAARINAHEPLHVNSTRGLHTTHIVPLERRVADRSLGLNIAAGEADAIARLRAIIRWPETISAFQAADRAANGRGGTVDAGDLGSGTYPVDAGPGVVGGKNYQHRVRLPGEPNPA